MYRKAWHDFDKMSEHNEQGWWQAAGVDRTVTLKSSLMYRIDEKVRGRNKKTGMVYDDILVEYLSDQQAGKPGWAEKPLLADYIAYAIAPLGKGYLLPVSHLQAAWREHKQEWIVAYPRIAANNMTNGRKWTTISCGIPVDVLFRALGDQLRLRFTAIEIDPPEVVAKAKRDTRQHLSQAPSSSMPPEERRRTSTGGDTNA